jgi:hypothetical protein
MLKLQGNSKSQVLFLSPYLESTLPDLGSPYTNYVWNYKNHISWENSDMMNDGRVNEMYQTHVDRFVSFLNSKGIDFKLVEKFHNGAKCNITRVSIDKSKIEIVEGIN